MKKKFVELGLTLHEVSDSDNLVYNSDYLHTLLLPWIVKLYSIYWDGSIFSHNEALILLTKNSTQYFNVYTKIIFIMMNCTNQVTTILEEEFQYQYHEAHRSHNNT